MWKIRRKLATLMFIGILGLSYITFSASVIRATTSNSKTVSEGQWVYSGRTSYPGSNTAYADGVASGAGKMQITEIVNNGPNSTRCSSTGSMGVNGQDLSCIGTANKSNSKIEAQAKYTNLKGSSNLTVKLVD